MKDSVHILINPWLNQKYYFILTNQIIDQLLVLRQQSPLCYHNLKQFHETKEYEEFIHKNSERKRKRLIAGGAKSIKKMLNSAQLLFDSIIFAFETTKIQQVAILFGGTIMNPKESFVIHFTGGRIVPTTTNDDNENKPKSVPIKLGSKIKDFQRVMKKMDHIKRNITKSLLTEAPDFIFSSLGITKTHVAILASPKYSSVLKEFYTVKRNFKIKREKKSHKVLDIHIDINYKEDKNKPFDRDGKNETTTTTTSTSTRTHGDYDDTCKVITSDSHLSQTITSSSLDVGSIKSCTVIDQDDLVWYFSKASIQGLRATDLHNNRKIINYHMQWEMLLRKICRTQSINLGDFMYEYEANKLKGHVDKESAAKRIKNKKLSLNDFDLLKVIGHGSIGRVLQVRHKRSGKVYAMKILDKLTVLESDQVTHTQTERAILQQINNPYIVNLHYAFQSKLKLYLVMTFVSGGDLFHWLRKEKQFSMRRVKFYAAEVLVALNTLHEHSIVFRDLKPENILMCQDGHIKLADFGIAKHNVTNATNGAFTFCGTPGYSAPEIILNAGHGTAVDWWAFGILIYEMLTGELPFPALDPRRLYDKVLLENVVYPSSFDDVTVDLLNRLLEKNPAKRFGSGVDGGSEIMKHEFWDEIDWKSVLDRNTKPEFVPPALRSDTDVQHFDVNITRKPVRETSIVTRAIIKIAGYFHGRRRKKEREKRNNYTKKDNKTMTKDDGVKAATDGDSYSRGRYVGGGSSRIEASSSVVLVFEGFTYNNTTSMRDSTTNYTEYDSIAPS